MTNWQPQRVETNGITLAIHRTGEGPTLVLLHGITDSGLCWIRVANDLARDYDVILVDARGHGDSDKPERGYTPDDHAADVAGLIDALGLDRPVLIGHSMGAQTAAVTAATYPDKVRALVLEDPPWRDDAGETDDDRMTWLQGRVIWLTGLKATPREKIIAQKHQESPAWAEEILAPWADAKLAVSMSIFTDIETIRRPWQAIVPQIACPFLLVTADTELGAIVSPKTTAAIAESSNAQTVHIPGAGHNIRREQFDAYRAAIRPFLAIHAG